MNGSEEGKQHQCSIVKSSAESNSIKILSPTNVKRSRTEDAGGTISFLNCHQNLCRRFSNHNGVAYHPLLCHFRLCSAVCCVILRQIQQEASWLQGTKPLINIAALTSSFNKQLLKSNQRSIYVRLHNSRIISQIFVGNNVTLRSLCLQNRINIRICINNFRQ